MMFYPAHASLREEIAGLEALEREMSRDLEGMMARQVRAAYERTVRGRIWTGIGVGIGVYCVYRIFGVSCVFTISLSERWH
jgi:predicted PurR-regulated permease PerM